MNSMQFPKYDFASHYLNIRTNRLHYLDEGPRHGEPVIMLHGNPTWSFFFRTLVTELRDKYRVIVPDHMGMGLSDKPDDTRYDYTLSSRVADLKTLLDRVEVNRDLTLVLHDWGGMIGLLYGIHHPDRIRRLVILNTGAFHLPPSKRFPWQLAFCRTPVLGPLLIRGANGFCRVAVRSCITHRPFDPEIVAAYLYPYDSWRNRIAIMRFVQDIPRRPGDRIYGIVSEVEAHLSRFRNIPALICWGLRDFIFDHHFLAIWRKHLPNAIIHSFENAGHYVLEDAGDEIARLVRRFLEDNPGTLDSKET
jgi:pimeloyl-ACP methyl ester carboxylesterase